MGYRSAVLAIFLLVQTTLYAQGNADSLKFMQMVQKAGDSFSRKAYDSSFILYQAAYKYALQKKLDDYYSVSACLVNLGHCLFNQNRYADAHTWYYQALTHARKYTHHKDLRLKALQMLNRVHKLLQDNDMSFAYPAVKGVMEQVVYYEIDSVFWQKGDSALVRINGGRLDGVLEHKNAAASVYSIKNNTTGQVGSYQGTAALRTISANKTIALITIRNPKPVEKGWLVYLLCNLSDEIANSSINMVYRQHIRWLDADRIESIFNRRFYFYYQDSLSTRDLMDLLLKEITDVASRLAPDTLKEGSPAALMAENGIFKGKNLIRSLNESNGAHINYFLRFLIQYPFDYAGLPGRFSELYGSWILGKTPMDKDDVKKFILGNEKISDEIIHRASLMQWQAEEQNLVNYWVDEGLGFADKNYWTDLRSQARLLYHYGRATGRADCRAWGDFFDAVRLKDFGLAGRADSLLQSAYKKFGEAGSDEGMQWIASVRQAVLDSTAVQMNIVKAHNLNYDIVASPNERYFATAGDDRTIKIWDINLGKQIKSINAHNNEILNITFNPGGRYLASTSRDSTIKIWNTFSYGLMNSIKAPSQVRRIRFSPDGKLLAAAGIDSTLQVYDPFKGNVLQSFRSPGGNIRSFEFLPEFPSTIYMTCTDSGFYSLDLKTGESKQLLKSDKAFWWMKVSKTGKYLCYYRSDSSFQIYNLQGGRYIFGNKFYVWQVLSSRYYSAGDFTPDEKYFVYMNPDSQTVVIDLDQRLSVPFYSYPTAQYVFNNSGRYYISQYVGAPGIIDFSNLDFNQAYSLYYNGNNQEERRKSYNLFKEKTFKADQGPVMDMFFGKEKNKLMVVSYGTISLDLASGKSEQQHPNAPWVSMYNGWPEEKNMVPFKNTGGKDTLFLFDPVQKNIIGKVYLPDHETINSFYFYENDRRIMVAGSKGGMASFETETCRPLFSISGKQNGFVPAIGIQKIPGTNKMILLRTGARPLIADGMTGSITDSINIPAARSIATNSSHYWIADTLGNLLKGMHGNYSKPDTVRFRAKSDFIDIIRLSPSGKYMTILDVPWCHVLETGTGKIVKSFIPDLKNIQVLAISADDSLLLTGSLNGEIALMRMNGTKPFAEINLPTPTDPIIKDTAGFYLASKTALQHVVFTKGYRAYNYDQFDLELNQPHKVLAAIGYADRASLEAYEKAREKRLRKMGFTGNSIPDVPVPSIIIHNRNNIKPATDQPYYTIPTECFDLKSKLAEIKVFINDVPHEEPIFNLRERDTGSIILNIAVPLTPGNNRVKIYCINKAGGASYKEYIDIFCTLPIAQQKTWFIGIGVARYADTAQNLQYSVKDVRDMVKKFKSMFPDLIVDTLLDKKVTLKEIALLKKRMEKIALTDRVIMAVTGHGLLSDSLDFYYATWDMNFSKPEEKGLPYAELEEMLNKTASRQKILLIDACHSGLVDKENVYPVKSVILTEDDKDGLTNIKETRGIKPKVTQKVDEANTFNLMQQFFADFSNDNGIVVISAAGGLEYALESPRWNNGVFTYSVLKGLEGEADLPINGGNGDTRISVQELMRFVGNRVPELTRGKQQPVSRRENLEFDWWIK